MIGIKTVIVFITTFSLTLTSSRAFSFQSISKDRVGKLYSYVPSGLTAEEYMKVKKRDEKKLGANLGRLGPRGFKSRSMQAWQEAYERGETAHSIAPFGYQKSLREGKIKKEDVPYMVRGGSWDNSDIPGAKRKRWLKIDKEYAIGGYKREQSVSILGSGPGFDWTGTRPREESFKKLVPGLS